jgi:NADH:ubiquinone oxidoreductase subunit 3 (subunit A)
MITPVLIFLAVAVFACGYTFKIAKFLGHDEETK